MLLYCPPSYEGVYHIPMGTSEIAGGAFFGCTKITKVVIPHGVTRINSSTFQKCTSLEYVNIPSTLERVDESAFYGCSSLKECILPPTVTSIYKSAFYGCSSLESIVLPASLDVVWDYTFYNCPSLKTVVFPEGVTNIRLWGFGSTSEIEVYNFASCIQGHSEGPTGLYPSKIHVSEGFQGTPTSGTLVYDLESISSISISKTSLNMIEGEASSVSCNILPSTASVKTLHYSSDNTDVVIVDSKGMVTAVGEGTAAITVSTLDGSNLAQRCVVTVRDKINVGLIDGNAFGNTSAYLTDNLTYSRTYKNTNWQAWYVPFDVTLTSDVLAQFSFAKFAGTYTEDDGTFFISVARMREGDVVKANTPYLVQAKTAGTEAQVLTLTDATLYAAQEKGFSMNSAEKTVTIQGIYNTKTATDENHEWYAFGGGKYIKASVGQTLSPYRFYMTITEREDNPYASTPNPTEVKIKVLGEDETGVAPLSVSPEEEKTAVYDLSGRRIEKEKATKGIYIINGKKIFVR